MHQGQLVNYLGGDTSVSPDGVGQVIDFDDMSRSAHVLWKSGSNTGNIGLYAYEDLVTANSHEGSFHQALDDSLEYGVMDDLGVTSSIDESLDYEAKDSLKEALFDAGTQAYRTARAALEQSIFLKTAFAEYDVESRKMMLDMYTKKALKDYTKSLEEDF